MKAFNTLTLATLCVLSANGYAADKPRIYDRSLDVDTRVYAIACPNGEMASVTVRYDIKEEDTRPISEEARRLRAGDPRPKIPNIIEVCAYPVSDQDKVCTASMDLQKAAQVACK